ncbi:MAG: squalene/phytoene synthase family protein [Ardenticatenales bacterium]|nr:squalene/phytoene synthase family protein [Ardenticatenales bacterium]
MSIQLGASHYWGSTPALSLEEAYGTCEAITRHYSKSFYFATAFLPEEKRHAIRAFYAFCRWSDNIVDEPAQPLGYSLEGWAAEARGEADESHPVLLAWHDLRQRYALSEEIIDELLAGMRMDLTVTRYSTFEALWLYCYRVASTVGLLSMQIIGHEEGATPYAITLGVALQLTNILRDVGDDARRGRIYLPLAELEACGLTEQDILDGRCDARYQTLMRFQIARAQRLYDEAWPGIARLHPEGRLAVATAATAYRAILPAIERNGYDNHHRRAQVSLARKLAMLPRLWWQVRFL